MTITINNIRYTPIKKWETGGKFTYGIDILIGNDFKIDIPVEDIPRILTMLPAGYKVEIEYVK